jgi:2,3-bisphosphoglycerate-dependent phosphoglycerate mutase
VWDFENPSARPPWGDRIAPTATSLGDYFVTSAGADLIETLESALRQARDTGKPLVIT